MLNAPQIRHWIRTLLRALPGVDRLRQWNAERHIDAYVVSYPKSGRTWLRFVLGSVLVHHFDIPVHCASEALETERLKRRSPQIPGIAFRHHLNTSTSHAPSSTTPSHFAGRAVVLLVRDPRDVIVSHYYHLVYREADLTGSPGFSGDISDFLRDPVFGISSVISYMNAWWHSRHLFDRFLLVRYEDMRADMVQQMVRLLKFLRLTDVPPSLLIRAVESGDFDRMRALEREADATPTGRIGGAVHPFASKVRSGTTGSYLSELNVQDIAFVDDTVQRDLIPAFGYETPRSS